VLNDVGNAQSVTMGFLTPSGEEQDAMMDKDSAWRYRLCFLDETDSLFYISEKVCTPASSDSSTQCQGLCGVTDRAADLTASRAGAALR
jgi:hypothetical protein